MLSITATLSDPAPRHGRAVRWLATIYNAGAAAPATAVQFFDGLPAEGGSLLGTRTIDLPPGPAQVPASILWMPTAGAHRLVAVVDPTNRAGEADVSRHVAEIQPTVVDGAPPIARAGADQVASVGQTVVFDGRASTDDDRITTYLWQYPPPAGLGPTRRPVLGFVLQGPYVALAGGFPGPGSYVVQLTVADTSGNVGSDQITVRVVDDFDVTPPTADAGTEIGAVVGAPVSFDGTGSHDDFGIARATWDVDIATDSDGDGDSDDDQDLAGLSPTLTHGYAKAGLYRARLAVSDAAGNDASFANVLVRVSERVDDCTVTVPPGGDVNRALELAAPGETICLRPAVYHTGTIVLSSPGVTLDGQGAVLDGTALGAPGIGVVVGTDATSTGGVTVRHLTVRGYFIGFLVLSGLGHRLTDNAAADCEAGFAVVAAQTLLERNRVERSGYGFRVYGADNRLVDNSASAGSVGFEVHGLRQRLEGNQACTNLTDIVGGLDLGFVSSSGADNACGVAMSWFDDGRQGCTFACARIRVPSSGLLVDQDTLFEGGTFELTSGLVVTGAGVRVRFAGTTLVGPPGVDVPGVEIRDAPGTTVTGGTIAGFQRGLQVQRSDGVAVDGLAIRDADVGIEVANSAQGALFNVSVTAVRSALDLASSTRSWTVDHGVFASEDETGAHLAGSDHSLRHNQVTGEVVLDHAVGAQLADNVIASRHEGIALLSSTRAEIRDNTVRGNAAGILVRGGSEARIAGNVVSGHRGILLDGGAEHHVDGNRVEALAAAIQLTGSRDVQVRDNTLAATRGPAIQLELASGNEIAGNDASGSMQGIDLHGSDSNRIHHNLCVTTRLLPSIRLVESTANEVSGNVLTDLWPGGVLALAASGNRVGVNELHASGAAPREIVTLGIGLIEQLLDSPGLPAADVARGLSLTRDGLRSFSGLTRLAPGTGDRFFRRIAAALRLFQRLAAGPRTLRRERDLLDLAGAQIASGARLAAASAIAEARAAGADDALLAEAVRLLEQGIALAAAGQQGRAADAFGGAWTLVSAEASSPARLSATMTVEGGFTPGGEVAYLVTLSNAGPRNQRDNVGDELFDRLPASLELTGATASSGEIRVDRAAGVVAWNGAVPAGGSVVFRISATIRPGTAGETIRNQGTVSFDALGDGLNTAFAPTDDPKTGEPADATLFRVRAEGATLEEIPALSLAGLVALALLLALAAAHTLRSR